MYDHTQSLPERCPIAIIGGGFSGVLVAIHLLQKATQPLLIKLIECQSELGRGVAYYDQLLKCHLLNVPAGKMGAFPDLPGDFLAWLHQHGYSEATATSFMPRRTYGDYIQDILQTALIKAAPGVRLEYINDQAVQLTTRPDQVNILLKQGHQIYAEKVVLALGNFPPGVPALITQMMDYEKYLVSGWSVSAIAKLPTTDNLLIVGSGLTMVDVVVGLAEKNFPGKIHVVSRHGLTPQRHRLTANYPAFIKLEEAPHHIHDLFRTVRRQIVKAGYYGEDWRGVIDSLRPITPQLWQKLPLVEKQRFLRHAGTYWEIHRHRIAPQIADIIDTMLLSGQLEILPARIQNCRVVNNQVNVTLQKRRSSEKIVLSVDKIINCTGSNVHYEQLETPLIKNLLNQGLISIHPTNIGINTASNGALLNSDGQPSHQLYTLGTPRKGDLWETTAVPEIRVHAANLAIELLTTLEEKQYSLVENQLNIN